MNGWLPCESLSVAFAVDEPKMTRSALEFGFEPLESRHIRQSLKVSGTPEVSHFRKFTIIRDGIMSKL